MAMLNKYIKNSIYAAALLGAATACEPEIEREIPSYEQARGNADFSTYVALGNSLTAGYSDAALNREGQENSYPAIIAEQLDYITPDLEFDQPLLPEGRANGTRLLSGFTPQGLPIITQESSGLSTQEIFSPVQGSFNNMGVPGAKAGDLTMPGYGSAQGNPYFARFASSQGTTVVQDAIAQNPTFFTLWIGNNDVLGYATTGGEGDVITEPSVFEEQYKAIINQLVASNANIEGAIANIPNVNGIPFLRTVAWNQFALDAEQATQINAAVQGRIEPAVRAAVDSVAKTQVIRGVIEAGTRRNIEAQARPAVAQAVATQIVYNQAYEQAYAAALDQGASEEQAEAIAEQQAEEYVASQDGQTSIENLSNALLNDQAPEAAQAAFEGALEAQIEESFNSEAVQGQMDTAYEAAINNMDNLEAYLGTEGAAAVEENFNSAPVVAMRDAGFNDQIEAFKAAGFYPTFAAGPNGFVEDDPDSPTGIRQLTADDLVTLTVSGAPESEFNPAGGDITIPGKYVLDVEEQEAVSNAIEAYNQIIAEVANENTLALVDMNAFFNTVVTSGITEGGTRFTNAFILGNAFSLDGVHLTQKGYALVAKRFIDTINNYYNSEIPEPNVRNYPAVGLPN